ncbi:MAG TPA: fluoride efflux transporter CrcB [Bellilinea sp.]|nr:fluoride efflux transporter CrcB [Bellilinea sp.]
MEKIILIGTGGFIGAVLRYFVGNATQTWSKAESFPAGTLIVNLIGCLVIGLSSHVREYSAIISPEARSFLYIGILGAFTTFSTFSNETVNLFRQGQGFYSVINVVAHILIGLTAVWLGRQAALLLWK